MRLTNRWKQDICTYMEQSTREFIVCGMEDYLHNEAICRSAYTEFGHIFAILGYASGASCTDDVRQHLSNSQIRSPGSRRVIENLTCSPLACPKTWHRSASRILAEYPVKMQALPSLSSSCDAKSTSRWVNVLWEFFRRGTSRIIGNICAKYVWVRMFVVTRIASIRAYRLDSV